MELKEKETRTKGVANTLRDDEIETIIATMDFFDASPRFLGQTGMDLKLCRYRLFDWLASCVDGRRKCGDGDNDKPIQVLSHVFLKVDGDVDKFIEDLRCSDYDMDHSWDKIRVEEE